MLVHTQICAYIGAFWLEFGPILHHLESVLVLISHPEVIPPEPLVYGPSGDFSDGSPLCKSSYISSTASLLDSKFLAAFLDLNLL